MKTKIVLIMAIFVLAIVAMGFVSAADVNDTDVISDSADDAIVSDEVLTATDEEVVSDGESSEDLVANFTNDISEGKDTATVKFTDASTGNVTSWLWDFGDGTNSSDQNPTHTYSKYGLFDVSLTVVDVNNTTNKITKTGLIEVYSSTSAIENPSFQSSTGWASSSTTFYTAATYSKDSGGYCRIVREGFISQTINFDVIGSSISFWARGMRASHSGTIFVYIDDEKLMQDSYSGTTFKEIEVDVSKFNGEHTLKISTTATGSTSSLILDCFTYAPSENTSINYELNSYTIDEGNISINFADKTIGKIIAWLWDFGDGTNSTEKNPTHIYTTPGTYNVTLTTYNKDTSTNITKNHIFSDLTNLNITNNATTGKDNLTVQFNGLVDGIVGEWLWDFGDGATSTEQNPIHTFIGEGDYTVTLTATNSLKKQNIVKTNLIKIVEDLTAKFITSSNSTFIYEPVYFTDKSANHPTTFLWDFGDGTFSNLQNPEHAYTKTGTYTVTLTVSNGTNSSNTSQSVTIKPLLVPDFTYEWSSSINRLSFYDYSWTNPHSTGDNIVLRVMDWGDGTNSSFTSSDGASASHTYGPGTYDVTYTIYDKDGASSSIIKKGIVTVTGGELNVIGVDSFEDNDTCGWTIVGGYLSNEIFYDSGWGEYREPASDGSWYVKGLDNGEYMEKEINFNEVDYINFWHFDETSCPIYAEIEIDGVWKQVLQYTSMSHNDHDYTPIDVSNYYGIHKFKIYGTYGTIDIDEIIYGNYDYNADFEVVSTEIVGDKISVNFKSTSTGAISGYEWDFNDGTTSTAKNPTHEFKQGNYTVTLLIKYNGAVMDSVSQVLELTLPTINGTSFNSIQSAIDNAASNEVIDIAPLVANSYSENLNINKSVTLNFNGASLKADNASLPLFNITNGASVVIKDLIIDTDLAIVTDSSSKLTLENAEIAANTTINGNVELNDVTVDDGAVTVEDGNVKIFNSTIVSNDVAVTQKGGELELISNLMTDNRIAVNVTGGKTKLQYNIIYNNNEFGLVYIGTGVNNTDNWWGNDFPSTSFGVNLSENYYDIFRLEDDGVEMDSWLVLTANATPVMGINKEYPVNFDLTVNSNDEKITGYLKTFYLPVTTDAGDIWDVEIVNGTGTEPLFTTDHDMENVTLNILGKEYDLDAKIMTKQDVNINVDGDLVENGTANVSIEIPFATGNVTVIVDGVETSLELNDTKANFTIPELTPGNHDIVVSYAGDDVFGATLSSANFTVAAKEIVTGIIKITGVDGNLTVNGILKDSNDNVMANEVINYQIGEGDIQNTTTKADGTFTLTGVNGATITVTYSGNDNIVGSTDSITLSDIASNDENNKTISDLEKQLTDANNKVENLTTELANAKDNSTQLNNELTDAKNNATQLNNELTDAKNNATQLNNELTDAKNNATQLNNELTDAKNNATQLNNELTDANNKVENLTSELADAKDNATQLNNELTDANSKVENLTTELADAKDKVANLTAQLADAQNNVTVVNNTLVGTVLTPDATEFTRWASDYNAGERGALFYVTLTDVNGNPLANKTIQFAINGKFYNNTTDANGRTGLQINIAPANTYTYAFMFQGDENYSAAPLSQSKLTVKAKTTSISASAKTFKATAKTKKVTVTLKTIKNAYDGKTYLKAGKKLTMKVNGVTYTAKINAKGQATFSIKLTKKGKYSAVIKFAGDRTYSASSKSIKITIK